MHLAAQCGLLELVTVLLNQGANPNVQTLYIEPPPQPKPVKTISKPQSVPEKLLPPANSHSQYQQRQGSNSSTVKKKAPPPLTTDQLLIGGMLDYNPFTLDDADNPFTEENDPSNPFLDNKEEAEVDSYNPFEESREVRVGSVHSTSE